MIDAFPAVPTWCFLDIEPQSLFTAASGIATTPATRPEFWAEKFQGNIARDERHHAKLLGANWRVAVVWECDINRSIETAADELSKWLLASSV
jgi:G:T-mismatch repair DNA endonuclease (very short patch repair protein)